MPKKVELTAVALDRKLTALQRAGTDGIISVGDPPGLLLQVRAPRPDRWKEPSGSAIWIYRYTNGTRLNQNGETVQRRIDLSLGAYGPTLDLRAARILAHQQRAMLLAGKDPKEERQRATAARLLETRGAVTFRKVAMDFITDQAKNGRWKKRAKNVTKGSAHQWEQTLSDYAFPKIGGLRIGDITRAHVLEVVEPIWTKVPVAAKRVQERIEEILDWAAVKDLRTGENPARWKGYLSKVLPSPTKITNGSKFPRVPVDQFPAFMRHLRASNGAAALALEWSILTMSRPGETLLMRRKDIDLKAKVWTIPAGKHNEGLKTAEARRIPISGAAAAVLKKVPGFDKLAPGALVFAGTDGGTMSENTLKAVIVRMHDSEVKAGRGGYTDPDQLHKTTGEPRVATAHGTSRSTTRDILTERAHFEDWLLEKCLGHREGDKTRGSYQRGDVLTKQREVVEKLAALASGKK